MKNRFRPLLVVLMLGALVLMLSACEKERPAPKAVNTPLPAGTGTPQANMTAVLLPGASLASPAPAGTVVAGTPAPPTPQSLSGATAPQPAGPAAGSAGSAAGSGKYFVYNVAAGDTLAQIARKFSTTGESLLALNQLSNADVLRVGQELKIPGDPPEGYGGLVSYTVQAGDTLASIAAKYGTSVAELQKTNNITDPNQVVVGQVIRVPGSAGDAARAGSPAGSPAGNTAQTGVYVVKAGETLASIARRFGISVAELQQMNNISDVNQINVGQRLKVPGTDGGAAGDSGGQKTHTVARGETLYSIAVRYGITVAALQQANNITNADQLVAGQTLKIP